MNTRTFSTLCCLFVAVAGCGADPAEGAAEGALPATGAAADAGGEAAGDASTGGASGEATGGGESTETGADDSTGAAETDDVILSTRKAFPTAEGYGARATGGRGGTILYVTTTEDTGEEGSLRWALQQDYPRIVYFLVGGEFRIQSRLTASGDDLTIAGETANDLGGVNITIPDDGADIDIRLSMENTIIRYIAAEGGFASQDNGGSLLIPFSRSGSYNSILDHYTGGWANYTGGGMVKIDVDLGRGGLSTTQHSLLHEGSYQQNTGGSGGILASYARQIHPDDDDAQLSTWGAWDGFSNHHNAFIGLTHRFFNTAGNGETADQIYNNYVYGWRNRMSTHYNGNQPIDIHHNYYEAAPYNADLNYGLMHRYDYREATNMVPPIETNANFYIAENLVVDKDGSVFHDVGDDDWAMLATFDPEDPRDVSDVARRYEPAPTPHGEMTLHATEDVKDVVLANVGAGVRFTADGTPYNDRENDLRYITWAREGTGPASTSQSFGDGGLGDHASFVHPVYRSGTRDRRELDEEGVPHGWQPPADVINDAGYSRLELYLAELAGDFHVLRAR
ncbi:MAG: hypothetical protein AAGA54_21965 [Myxococcota bacterium]